MADDAGVLSASGAKKRALRVLLHTSEGGGPADGGVPVVGATLVPLGYAQDTTISAATALPTVPAATTVALIQAEGANCRWRDDRTDPTASVGTLLGAGCSFWYRGTFSAFKIIQVSSGGVLNVTYYQEVAE